MKIKLGEIASIRTGFAFRTKVERDPEGMVGVVQMKDLNTYNQLDLSDIYKVQVGEVDDRHFLQPNDILFRSRGVSNTASLIREDLKRFVAAAPLTLIRVTEGKAVPAYVCWFINHPHGQSQISRFSKGTSQQLVNNSDLGELEIDLPPIDKQRAIAELADLGQQEQRLMVDLAEKRRFLIDTVLIQRAKALSKE